ncbi:DUF4440 domain-containing protein [Bacillus subtilis subsp. subtilis]|nr:DUF4440 domain-containing protein [Bacillus subtilis subsp. subtilis]
MKDTPASHQIHALHGLIEDWFNARLPVSELDTLMAHFAVDFSMVGITGQRLDRDAVRALFLGGHGARPGLAIVIDAECATALDDALVMARYREGHARGNGAMCWRESLALLRREDGCWRWVALQETPCA